MSSPISAGSYESYRVFSAKVDKLQDISLPYILEAFILTVGHYQEEMRLPLADMYKLTKCINAIECRGNLSKREVALLLCGSTSKSHLELPAKFASFFLLDSNNRWILSPTGLSLSSAIAGTFRRVVQEREYYLELKYGRYTKEARDKRRAKKRFYKDLSADEQIAVLREYYAMPYRTDEEKRARKKARIELFRKYDLINYDLLNAIKMHGNLVKSVRSLPGIRELFT